MDEHLRRVVGGVEWLRDFVAIVGRSAAVPGQPA